jgi:hypothetical protein
MPYTGKQSPNYRFLPMVALHRVEQQTSAMKCKTHNNVVVFHAIAVLRLIKKIIVRGLFIFDPVDQK